MTADICVVVPTIRNPECVREYVANAYSFGFDTDRLHLVLVTEAFCDIEAMEATLDDLGVEGRVFDGPAREAWLEANGVAEYGHLIPEASHAQTSFGLLYLWAENYPYGVFIDDDTRPHEDVDFFGTHVDNLAFEGAIEHVRSDERWVNVLYQRADEHGLYPRGYPYGAMDETVRTTRERSAPIVASQGLWTDVPDLDAVRILMDGDLEGQAQTRTRAEHFERDFVAEESQYLTVCSMNLAFRREVVPAFYQFPMDDNRWDVGRFDDIWSGLTLKRACDLLGGAIYNGQPLCHHEKAPRSTFSDLVNEVHGLECNEHFWEVIDEVDPWARDPPDVDPALTPEAFAIVARAVGRRLAAGEFDAWENGPFLAHCGEYLLDWVDCLEVLQPTTVDADDRVQAVADD